MGRAFSNCRRWKGSPLGTGRTNELQLWRLEEQDTDTKLATLFRANLYQLALQVARRAGRDENAQSGILRLYGDHLYK